MSAKWLSYVSLSDDYERKARFIPGLFSLLPLLPVSAAYGAALWDQLIVLTSGVGLAAVGAVAISHIASAFGNRMQRKLWPDWPHDSPTNRWLQPDNAEISTQQRKLWYHAIKKITGLDIGETVSRGCSEEINSVINDAINALRDLLWKAPEADRVRLHNVDYGFARNLTGLRVIWVPFAVASALACWAGFIWLQHPLLWCVVSTAIAAAAIPLGYTILPGYVREKANYYAESFFGAIMLLGKARG